MNKLAYTLPEAAALTPFSEGTLRRAIHSTDPNAFPPPLEAKRDGKGRFIVLARVLDAWLDSLQDA